MRYSRTAVASWLVAWCIGCSTNGNDSSARASGGSNAGVGGSASDGGGVSGGAASTGSGGTVPANGGSTGGAVASGGTGTGGSGTGGAANPGSELLRADFEQREPGVYTQAMVEGDFAGAPAWNDGLDEERASIVEDGGNRFLRITYAGGQYGPADGGVQFIVPFGGSYDELYLSYRVRFAAGFEFVLGGKIPGLVGGSAPTGCTDDDTGFSARMMWRAGGRAVQYMYLPNKLEACGDDYDYRSGAEAVHFTPGSWHTVEHRIVMNAAGALDGVLQAWFDGNLVLDEAAMEYRLDEGFAIDALYFSTFYGGGDASWAPPVDQVADYDDFVVSTGPIRQ